MKDELEGKTIDITPNFDVLFRQFMGDAERQAVALKTKAKTGNDQARREDFALSKVREMLVSLNIACHSVHDSLTFYQFKDKLDRLTSVVVESDNQRTSDNLDQGVNLTQTALQQKPHLSKKEKQSNELPCV